MRTGGREAAGGEWVALVRQALGGVDHVVLPKLALDALHHDAVDARGQVAEAHLVRVRVRVGVRVRVRVRVRV